MKFGLLFDEDVFDDVGGFFVCFGFFCVGGIIFYVCVCVF